MVSDSKTYGYENENDSKPNVNEYVNDNDNVNDNVNDTDNVIKRKGTNVPKRDANASPKRKRFVPRTLKEIILTSSAGVLSCPQAHPELANRSEPRQRSLLKYLLPMSAGMIHAWIAPREED